MMSSYTKSDNIRISTLKSAEEYPDWKYKTKAQLMKNLYQKVRKRVVTER